jgi:hypothetical protein
VATAAACRLSSASKRLANKVWFGQPFLFGTAPAFPFIDPSESKLSQNLLCFMARNLDESPIWLRRASEGAGPMEKPARIPP